MNAEKQHKESQLVEPIQFGRKKARLSFVDNRTHVKSQFKLINFIQGNIKNKIDNKHVIQCCRINLVDKNDNWWQSSPNFELNHLPWIDKDQIIIPNSKQQWLDWRADRWKGFSSTLPNSTLITGDLAAALDEGLYKDMVPTEGKRFEVSVKCDCVTVIPPDGSALTVRNVRIVKFSGVKLGGYSTNSKRNGTRHVIDHTCCGINYE